MNAKKEALLAIVIGISVISSFLIYPVLSEKTEMTVPVLKNFSENDSLENAYPDDSEIWEDEVHKPNTESVLPNKKMQSETTSAAVFPIDINAAGVEELTQLEGIGKATAEKIISYRESFGYFYSVDDLLNVDGLGSKKLDRIRDYVCINTELLPETTVDSETEYTDDNRIIGEITDFEGAPQTKSKAEENSETTSEEYYPNFPLELNTASAKDLAYIEGIGDTLAEEIVEYARSCGFYEVNDLRNVSGIGEVRFNKILPYVYVDASGLPPKT